MSGFLAQNPELSVPLLSKSFNKYLSVQIQLQKALQRSDKILTSFKKRKRGIKAATSRPRSLLSPHSCTMERHASGNSFPSERQDSWFPGTKNIHQQLDGSGYPLSFSDLSPNVTITKQALGLTIWEQVPGVVPPGQSCGRQRGGVWTAGNVRACGVEWANIHKSTHSSITKPPSYRSTNFFPAVGL